LSKKEKDKRHDAALLERREREAEIKNAKKIPAACRREIGVMSQELFYFKENHSLERQKYKVLHFVVSKLGNSKVLAAWNKIVVKSLIPVGKKQKSPPKSPGKGQPSTPAPKSAHRRLSVTITRHNKN
jgi:hypothetical protein